MLVITLRGLEILSVIFQEKHFDLNWEMDTKLLDLCASMQITSPLTFLVYIWMV